MPTFAFHRLIIPLQPKWSPVKLGGTAEKGSVEFADLHRPRLGVRWEKKATKDPEGLIKSVMRAEVGKLAADEAEPFTPLPEGASHALLYRDNEPYKRDVAVMYFPASRRLVQVSYPLRRREIILEQEILPGIAEVPPAEPAPWSVFELTCLTPPGLVLDKQRFNAGDLALFFTGPRKNTFVVSWFAVRQLAAATLALGRMPLIGWMRTMQKADTRMYRGAKAPEETTLIVAGAEYPALRLAMPRKKRYLPLPWIPKALVTLGCHDTARDRVVLLHGTDEATLRQLAATVGAQQESSVPA